MQKVGLNKLLSTPYWRTLYFLSSETHVLTIDGQPVEFLTQSYTEFLRFNDLVGEKPIIEQLLRDIEENDVFYDIGANVGTYSCFVASKLDSGTVVAFEPEPKNIARLRENLELNDLEVEAAQVALSNSNGKVELSLSGTESGEGKHSIATESTSETICVEGAKADSIIPERGFPKPTVVKIDVEGAEMSVLRGMRNHLQDSCRVIYVEVHPEKLRKFGSETGDVFELLENAGFEVDEIAQRGAEFFLRASK